ncbi:MAG: hypothetical protein JWP45_386 [Mucilaginibacter sp.]|nr:hypothetical protein [Mucilaginibacter sp.]
MIYDIACALPEVRKKKSMVRRRGEKGYGLRTSSPSYSTNFFQKNVTCYKNMLSELTNTPWWWIKQKVKNLKLNIMEDHAKELGVMVAILVPIALFTMIFGIVYLAKRERMAMIERGMDPRRYKPQSAPFQNLKWGLLLIGSGLGLFLAYILDYTVFSKVSSMDSDGNVAIYFALIAIFGGAGLVLSYRIEKKEADLEKVD